MRFFKHFTDAHRGTSLQSLTNQLGLEGLARYWILVEICAEKLSKEKHEECTAEHCVFRFDQRYMRDTLRTHQLSRLSMFLRCVADVGLMSFSCEDNVVVISMPKLLEYMDRDTKRARTKRAPSAPKIKNKIKNKNKDIEINDANDLVNAIGNEGIGKILELFPQDLIDYEFPFMAIWLKENGPKKNYLTFAVNWLKKAQKDRDQELAKQTKVDKTMGLVVA